MFQSRFSWRRLRLLLSCCSIQFLFGSLYALSVFVPNAPDPRTFISLLGVTALSTAIGISSGGILLHGQTNLKLIAFFASTMQLTLVTVVWGELYHLAWLKYISAVMNGTSYGVLYIASISQLQREFFERPGLITGIGMFSSGIGSILLASTYAFLQNALGWSAALYCCSIFLFVTTMIATYGMTGHSDAGTEEEHMALLGDGDLSLKLTMGELLTDLNLYLFLASFSAGVGPGYGIAVGYQQMAIDVHSVTTKAANAQFLLVTASGLIGRLIAGYGGDTFKFGSGVFSNACQNIMMILLFLQMLAIVMMRVLESQFMVFLIGSCVIYFVFAGAAVAGAILARELFGQANSAVVFGFTGFAVGFGDLVSSWMVQIHAGQASSDVHSLGSLYGLFFSIGAIWTAIGALALAITRKSSKAYPLLTCRMRMGH